MQLKNLATKTSTTKTIGKLLHARTTTKSTTTTTTTTVSTALASSKIETTTAPKRQKIFFIKPIKLRKRPSKTNLKERDTKSLIGYNGLFDLNSLKVFTKNNFTSLSSSRNP